MAFSDEDKRCPSDVGNTWIYSDAPNWYFAEEGLYIRCIEEEGMNTWQDEIIT